MSALVSAGSLRRHYQHFLRDDRVLLTGHSHQAWPDVARAAQLQAFDDAAMHVDDKWSLAFEAARSVRESIANTIDCAADEVALAANTHELVARFLSALPLRERPRVVTTGGEFHSIHRQLSRLAEEGVEVVFVAPAPVATLSERLGKAIDARTSAVLLSTVLFETSSIVPHLHAVLERADAHGTHVLLDIYHAFGIVPFSLRTITPHNPFVVGGGYKYAQWGEGNCFMRVPSQCTLRPVYTGWFADFAHLSDRRENELVSYGTLGSERFAGSTYDPTSHYRARAVIEFFREHKLTVPALRERSLAQTQRLIHGLDGFDIATPRDDNARGGFVSIRTPDASQLVSILRTHGIVTDSRGELLRLGPAPYTTDDEIDRATSVLRATRSTLPNVR